MTKKKTKTRKHDHINPLVFCKIIEQHFDNDEILPLYMYTDYYTIFRCSKVTRKGLYCKFFSNFLNYSDVKLATVRILNTNTEKIYIYLRFKKRGLA